MAECRKVLGWREGANLNQASDNVHSSDLMKEVGKNVIVNFGYAVFLTPTMSCMYGIPAATAACPGVLHTGHHRTKLFLVRCCGAGFRR